MANWTRLRDHIDKRLSLDYNVVNILWWTEMQSASWNKVLWTARKIVDVFFVDEIGCSLWNKQN